MKEVIAGRRNGAQWTLWTQLDEIDYVDNVALLSHAYEHMQRKATTMGKVSKSIGLNIHSSKLKVVKVQSKNKEHVRLNRQPLKEVLILLSWAHD